MTPARAAILHAIADAIDRRAGSPMRWAMRHFPEIVAVSWPA